VQGLQAGESPSGLPSGSPGELSGETPQTKPEQSELVAGITRNLKQRSLTSPAGDNALEKIQRLQEVHPLHDYSVNGKKYIARIFMVLGRRAIRDSDPELAQQRLQKAIQFDPQVVRQSALRDAIAAATDNSEDALVEEATDSRNW